MKSLIILLLTFFSINSIAQNSLRFIIKDAKTHEALAGVTCILEKTTIGNISDENGALELKNLHSEKVILNFSFIGYEPLQDSFLVSENSNKIISISLEPTETKLDEVFVTATRQSRTIENAPTRIEAITHEELEENAMMNSSNIAMLLQETTGIQVQQTSQSSGSSYIRIQGLDGRYTQIVRDGFPLYEGFSSGLSILQIPPLDLRQIEVIKGSSSTLYGGGAIAGLINLVSKVPSYKRESSLMVNQTNAGGSTINGFYSKRNKNYGTTLYTSVNNQFAYDGNKDGFSDIPKMQDLSFNPKFFWFINDSSSFNLALNNAYEYRDGGDMKVINEKASGIHQYSEQDNSYRFSVQLNYDKSLRNQKKFNAKGSFSTFTRQIKIPGYTFKGIQYSGFSEATYSFSGKKTSWISGANILYDQFNEWETTAIGRDYDHVTLGAFLQSTLDLSRFAILETGFRTDYTNNYKLFALPRASLLIKINKSWSSRLGGGLGYKLPTIFTEETENRSYYNISGLNDKLLKAEHSEGANFDINYKKHINEDWSLSFNQLFFYSRLINALILNKDSDIYYFNNADKPVDTRGFETNFKISYDDLSLYFNYSFIDARLRYNNNQQKPLTPKNNLGMSLLYEKENKWKIGYEIYYTGNQWRTDYTKTPGYWIMGAMAMRTFRKINVFINFENFTNTRQSDYEALYNPPVSNPEFKDIWAPIDGFVANGGVKVDF
jgi:iron complex outermembrane receptor protein